MTKNTMGIKLSRKLEQKMSVCGRADKTGSIAEEFECGSGGGTGTCSPLTVFRIEKGAPMVAIGIYLRVLYVLQLDDDILWLVKEDKLGKVLQNLSLKTRERASKKE